ncbi:peroxisome biogenesis factor 10 [Anopheles bellator]|uniref:peroxisome biogenesis factor 10 n=1 Tax=Anopheles bellator TaxID=139047 RepID=UPI0026483CFE|nr:peroxisome biogenesis factor 10 [Anopheles bellator]
MSLFHANAGQAEIIRSVQKDQEHIEEIRVALSELLLMLSQRRWYRYNALCKLIAEILYHHYAIANNLQTLGEEYTGIIQVDSNYVMLPNKALQLLAILLEYGGERLANSALGYLQNEIDRNDELLPSAKGALNQLIDTVRVMVPFVRGFHTSLFYINGGKYHISKRLVGINYVLIRSALKENHSMLGYRVLGYASLVQLVLTLVARYRTYRGESKSTPIMAPAGSQTLVAGERAADASHNQCALCMNTLQNISVTQCGHMFCWQCIFDWVDQRPLCPICRETIKKSRIVRLQNVAVSHRSAGSMQA